MTEEELKEIEDRASVPASPISGLEVQLKIDIKLLIAEVRSLHKSRKPPYQTGA